MGDGRRDDERRHRSRSWSQHPRRSHSPGWEDLTPPDTAPPIMTEAEQETYYNGQVFRTRHQREEADRIEALQQQQHDHERLMKEQSQRPRAARLEEEIPASMSQDEELRTTMPESLNDGPGRRQSTRRGGHPRSRASSRPRSSSRTTSTSLEDERREEEGEQMWPRDETPQRDGDTSALTERRRGRPKTSTPKQRQKPYQHSTHSDRAQTQISTTQQQATELRFRRRSASRLQREAKTAGAKKQIATGQQSTATSPSVIASYWHGLKRICGPVASAFYHTAAYTVHCLIRIPFFCLSFRKTIGVLVAIILAVLLTGLAFRSALLWLLELPGVLAVIEAVYSVTCFILTTVPKLNTTSLAFWFCPSGQAALDYTANFALPSSPAITDLHHRFGNLLPTNPEHENLPLIAHRSSRLYNDLAIAFDSYNNLYGDPTYEQLALVCRQSSSSLDQLQNAAGDLESGIQHFVLWFQYRCDNFGSALLELSRRLALAEQRSYFRRWLEDKVMPDLGGRRAEADQLTLYGLDAMLAMLTWAETQAGNLLDTTADMRQQVRRIQSDHRSMDDSVRLRLRTVYADLGTWYERHIGQRVFSRASGAEVESFDRMQKEHHEFKRLLDLVDQVESRLNIAHDTLADMYKDLDTFRNQLSMIRDTGKALTPSSDLLNGCANNADCAAKKANFIGMANLSPSVRMLPLWALRKEVDTISEQLGDLLDGNKRWRRDNLNKMHAGLKEQEAAMRSRSGADLGW